MGGKQRYRIESEHSQHGKFRILVHSEASPANSAPAAGLSAYLHELRGLSDPDPAWVRPQPAVPDEQFRLLFSPRSSGNLKNKHWFLLERPCVRNERQREPRSLGPGLHWMLWKRVQELLLFERRNYAQELLCHQRYSDANLNGEDVYIREDLEELAAWESLLRRGFHEGLHRKVPRSCPDGWRLGHGEHSSRVNYLPQRYDMRR